MADFRGYRSLWIQPSGAFVHTEPEEALELEGCRHVATLHRPTSEEVLEHLLRTIPVEPAYAVRYTPVSELPANLVAAS